MTERLVEISESLKNMIANHDAKIRLVVQTGHDETGLIATSDGYLRLAQTLIEFVSQAEAQETQVWDIYDRQLQSSTSISRLHVGGDEVQLDSMMLARTQDEANEVAEAFLGGMPLGASRSDVRVSEMSQEEREVLAQEYEQAGEKWIEARATLTRRYNREWAKFLRGQTD